MRVFFALNGALIMLMLVSCGDSIEEKGKTKEDIFNLALTYPPIGVPFNDKSSPCYEGEAPERKTMNAGYYCSRGFSELIEEYVEENPEADNPAAYQTFKYLEDGSLHAVVTGFNNMFSGVEEAEAFLKGQFGDLELQHRYLKNDFYNQGGSSLRYDFSTTEQVLEWNKLQMSFGCNVLPSYASPKGRIPFDSPEYDKWEGVLGEFIGSYSWLTDISLGKFVDFEIYQDNIDKAGASRCVLATVIYGDRKQAALSSNPRKVVEVVFAEVDPSFPLTSKNFRN